MGVSECDGAISKASLFLLVESAGCCFQTGFQIGFQIGFHIDFHIDFGVSLGAKEMSCFIGCPASHQEAKDPQAKAMPAALRAQPS